MKACERVAVLGPGAVGGLLAALCWKAGYDVLCIGRQESVRAIQKDGIHVESPVYGNFTAQPRASEELVGPVDVLFITVKSPHLSNAIGRLAVGQVGNAVVVPLLNGVGHREVIRARLGSCVAVGTIGLVEAIREEDGRIRHHSKGYPHIDIASDNDVAPSDLDCVAKMIQKAGIPTFVHRTEAEVIWGKLVRLSAVASLTAAFQEPLGAIRSDPGKRLLLEETVCEAASVASHDGVDIDPGKVIAQIDSFPSRLTTSLQRDIAASHSSEVESITGGVIRLANSYGIAVPAHVRLYEMIAARSRHAAIVGERSVS